MRKFTFLAVMFCLFGFGNIANAQIVNIPDANFKAKLVGNSSINTNGDGEIQTTEAVAYTGTINVSSSNIYDLTGIETFTVLSKLYCEWNHLTSLNLLSNTSLIFLSCNSNQLTSLNLSANSALTDLNSNNNQLTSLNLSANTSLKTLWCNDNQLTNLNISTCTALTSLSCNSNQLTSLDFSANTALTYLDCDVNQLTSLNFSANMALVWLECEDNQITSLNVTNNSALRILGCSNNQLLNLNLSSNTALEDLFCSNNQLTNLNLKNGNNVDLTTFYANDNPNLSCIQVDDSTYMSNNWASAKDSTAFYSEDCTVGISELINTTEIKTYPNPTTGKLAVSLSSGNIGTIEIYNLIGEKVYEKNFNQQKPALSKVEGSTEINLSKSPSGIYLLKISEGEKVYTSKIVVQ